VGDQYLGKLIDGQVGEAIGGAVDQPISVRPGR
jgi:hypothetical protein